jgi:pimeloyl-ACP methyl ester carboxylesterase
MSAPPVEYAAVRLPNVDASVKVAFRRAGPTDASTPPALLLHGLGLTSYTWRFVQQRLEEGRPTLAVDLLGFGRTEKPPSADYSLPGIARAVLALMDALGIEKTALVGHSLGGGVALLAAGMAPGRVERLALVGSVGYPQPEPPFVTWPRLPLAWLPLTLFRRKFIGEGLRLAFVHPERLSRDAIEEYAAPYAHAMGAKAYVRVCRALKQEELAQYNERYPTLDLPALILHGERDNVVPRWVAERLAADLPRAELHILPGMGHMLPEEEPELTADLLRPFLTSSE